MMLRKLLVSSKLSGALCKVKLSTPTRGRGFGTSSGRNVKISSQDLQKLNETSSRLYKIFLKSLPKNMTAKGPMDKSYMKNTDEVEDGNNLNCMLFQPPLNHRDYGQARLMDASITSTWNDKKLSAASGDDEETKRMIQDVVSFFLWQTQYQNTNDDIFHHKQLEMMLSQMKRSGKDDGDAYQEIKIFQDYLEKSIFTLDDVMKMSLREGFRLLSSLRDEGLTKDEIVTYQRWAIAAIQLFQEQLDMWSRTSISVDHDRGLRITATSSCIGTTAVGHLSTNENRKNRFCYRIRIENFNQPNTGIDDEENVFQLLGRMWKIEEDREEEEEGIHDNVDIDDHDDGIVIVDAPTTGVVGHLPVIRPGEIFEYMSSCDLKTPTGMMSGHFHMAVVDDDTESAQVGDPVDAFHVIPEKQFEIPVAPFRLDATGMVQ